MRLLAVHVAALAVFAGVATAETREQVFARRDAARKQLLTTTKLPQLYMEEWRVVDPNTPAARVFQAEMLALHKQLRPDIDHRATRFRFYVVDDPRPLAFAVSKAQSPAFFFSTGALKLAKTPAHLGWLLRHEVRHWQMRAMYGPAHKNTKAEEGGNDVLALHDLVEAGLNPELGLEMAKAVFGNKPARLDDVFDVHPLSENRIRAMEDYLAHAKLKRGRFGRVPILTAGLAAAADLTCPSCRLPDAEMHAWDGADNAGKLTLLEGWVARPTPWNKARVTDIRRLIRTLKIDRRDDAQRKAQDRLANRCLDMAAGDFSDQLLGAAFYTDLTTTVTHYEPQMEYRERVSNWNAPLGRLAKLDRYIRRFVRAQTAEDARDYAAEILSIYDALKLPSFLPSIKDTDTLLEIPIGQTCWRELATYQFRFPDIEQVERGRRGQPQVVSWNEHVEWMSRDPSGDIGKALYIMGVADRRIYERMTRDAAEDILIKRKRPISQGPRDGSTKTDYLKIDDEGVVRRVDTQYAMGSNAETVLLGTHGYLLLEDLRERALAGDQQAAMAAAALDAQYRKTEVEVSLYAIDQLDTRFERVMALNAGALKSGANRSVVATIFTQWATSGDQRKRQLVRRYFFRPGGSGSFKESVQSRLADKMRSGGDASMADPLCNFVLSNPGNLFSREEQYQVYSIAVDNHSLSDLGKHRDRIQRAFGIVVPQSGAALSSLVVRLLKTEHHILHLIAAEALREHMTKKRDGLRVLEVARALASHNREDIAGKATPLLRKRVSTLASWGTTYGEIIANWSAVQGLHLFPEDSDLDDRVLQKALDQIGALPDAKKRANAYVDLLTQKARIKNPDQRKTVRSGLVSALVECNGLDTGRAPYRDRLRPMLNRLDKHLNYVDREALYAELATRVSSQGLLTDEVSRRLTSISERQLRDWSTLGMASEGLLMFLKADQRGRRALLQLVLSRGKLEDRSAFADVVRDLLLEQIDAKLGDPHSDKFMHARERDAGLIHGNFWSMPLEGRIILFESVLFPVGGKEAEFADGYDFVMSKLFPPDLQHSKTARKFADAYFKILQPYQRRAFVSAAVVAGKQCEESSKPVGVGRRLGLVLELLGPAETKLGQALHSHPLTPDEIREGLKGLKSMADPPRRWEMFALFQKHVPRALRNQIKYVHGLIGSASYYVVFEVEMKSGERQVLAVLRPFAQARAEAGFENMSAMARELEQDGEVDDDTHLVIQEALSQAEEFAAIETNSRIATRQNELMASMDDGQRVRVGGEEFTLRVPRVNARGRFFRLMDKAPGGHFNELPETTPAHKQRKARIAAAYFTYQLGRIVAGGRIDVDRHGEQMRVEGNDLYVFDPGRMALEGPTTEERIQLGEAMFDAFAEAAGDPKQVSSVLLKQLRERKRRGEPIRYLVSVQNALLALQDFQKHMSSDQVQEAVHTVLNTGAVHKDVVEGVARRAQASPLKAMGLMQKPTGSEPVELLDILRKPRRAEPSRPKWPTSRRSARPRLSRPARAHR